jgi:hypothetical protein
MIVTAAVALFVCTFVASYIVERRRRNAVRRLAEQQHEVGPRTDPRGFEGPIGAEGHFRTGLRRR